MTVRVGGRVRNAQQVSRRFSRIATRDVSPARLRPVLRAAAQPAADELRASTPVRTGRLQASTDVRENTGGHSASVAIGWFGVYYGRFVEDRYGLVAAITARHRRRIVAAVSREVSAIIRRARRR